MRGPHVGAVLLALVLLAAPFLTVTLVSGGPPAEQTEGRGTTWAPRLESWSLVSAGEGNQVGGLLCTDEEPCDPDATADTAAHGDPCAWTGRIWLTPGPLASAFPVVLLEPEILIYAVIQGGSGRYSTEFPLEWDEGAWWRAEAQRVTVTTPVPCDATRIQVSLNVHGRTPTGDEYRGAQTVEAELLDA